MVLYARHSLYLVLQHKLCVCIVITYSRVQINRVGLPILPVGKPRLRLKNWSRETGSAIPSGVSVLIFHTQAESGAYSRDSSRVPWQRRFIYTVILHRVSLELIGPSDCVPMAFTAESPPDTGLERVLPFQVSQRTNFYAPLFSHAQYW